MTIDHIHTRRILAAAVVIPIAMLIAAPVVAIVAQRNGPPPNSAQARCSPARSSNLAPTIPQPLRFVGGAGDLADGVATTRWSARAS